MAENPDTPITRFTSLEINADPSSPSSVFAPAVLTQAEIDDIPLDDLRAGGIVYNITVGSLQTYTINGWENVASGGGTDTFENINVTDTATIDTLNVSGTTTTEVLSVTDIITTQTLNVSGAAVITNNLLVNGTIYGLRPSGGMLVPVFQTQPLTITTIETRLPITTTSSFSLNEFVMPSSNRLQYIGLVSPINVLITLNFGGAFSVDTAINIQIAKNGSLIQPTVRFPVTIGNGVVIPLTTTTTLSNNDYIELWGKADVAGTWSGPGSMYLTVTEI